jgi:DNA polymerase
MQSPRQGAKRNPHVWPTVCKTTGMSDFPGAAPFVPSGATLAELWVAAQRCQGCELYRNATQAVLGAGPATARVTMVREQPGDKEDLAGQPFVGPAGRLLDHALEEAGIARSQVYVTNAVKHFKFEERGKRRIHKKPSESEIVACQPWIEAELALIRPEWIVCLGATTARAVIGKKQRLLAQRGRFFSHPMARGVTATVHPPAILRAPDAERRERDFKAFVADLKAVSHRLKATSGGASGAQT